MARFRIRDKQGREYGPVDASELRSWIMDARLTADMLIQQEGLTDWFRAGDLPAIARLLAKRAAIIAQGHATGASGGGSGTPPPDSGTSAGPDSFPPDDDAYSYSRPEDAVAAPPSPPSPPTPTPQHNPPTFHPPMLWRLLPDRVIARLVAALCVNLVISVGLSSLVFYLTPSIYRTFFPSPISSLGFVEFRMLWWGAGLFVANIVFLAVFIGSPSNRRGA